MSENNVNEQNISEKNMSEEMESGLRQRKGWGDRSVNYLLASIDHGFWGLFLALRG